MYRSIAPLLLLLASTLAAAPAAVAQDMRVAYVNINQVLEQAPQAIAANKRLEKEFEPRNAALNELRRELRSLEDQLARDGLTMSESQLRRLELDIRSRKREITRAQEDFREDLNIRRNDELRKLQKRTYEAIVELARREKYDMVLGDVVIYAGPSVDITEKVLKVLADEHKAEGAN